jgi:hypothetical protein
MSGESPEELAEMYWNSRRLPLRQWVLERLNNAKDIAGRKIGADRLGWLEDARYYEEILTLIEKAGGE